MLRTTTLAVALVSVAAGASRADDFLANTATSTAAPPAPSHASSSSSSSIDLLAGVEGGGAPFLAPPGGPVATTTAMRSLSIFARYTVPILSTRLEANYVPGYGAGLTLESFDLHIGRLRWHLLDLGVFDDLRLPLTVSRVARQWDVAVGTGIELTVIHHVDLVADVRWFAPADIWSVVTRYGDTARLIGDEVIDGAQVWAGAALRW